MYRTIVCLLGILLSTGSFAAHHEEPEPMVAEVYECSLNDGVTGYNFGLCLYVNYLLDLRDVFFDGHFNT